MPVCGRFRIGVAQNSREHADIADGKRSASHVGGFQLAVPRTGNELVGLDGNFVHGQLVDTANNRNNEISVSNRSRNADVDLVVDFQGVVDKRGVELRVPPGSACPKRRMVNRLLAHLPATPLCVSLHQSGNRTLGKSGEAGAAPKWIWPTFAEQSDA